MQSTEQLDREELLGLAEVALNKEDTETAIGYLKRALALDENDVMARYVLATIHASIGMHARAVEGIEHVLATEPDFHAARFQLGMIYLANGDNEGLLKAWEHFATLPEDDSFYLFRRGIEHYFFDREQECLEDLRMAIERNTEYPSMTEDMQNILNEIADGVGE